MATIGGLNPNVGALRPEAGPNPGPARDNRLDRGAFRARLEALGNARGADAGPAGPGAATAGLKFSNHAIDRMRSRGVGFTPAELERIQNGVDRAAAKGSRETLLMTDRAALIVSVKDRTVVTVMDKDSLKDNVFTNIDSTVVV